MKKITFTLINRFQINCRYHASLTQSLPSLVNLLIFKIEISTYEKNLYFYGM